MKHEPGTRVIITRLPAKLHERLRKEAFGRRIPQAEIVRDALDKHLKGGK